MAQQRTLINIALFMISSSMLLSGCAEVPATVASQGNVSIVQEWNATLSLTSGFIIFPDGERTHVFKKGKRKNTYEGKNMNSKVTLDPYVALVSAIT